MSPFELSYSFSQFADFICDSGQGFGEWIVDLLGIGDHDTLAFAKDDVTRNADHGGVVGNIAQHDGASADAAVLADSDVSENLAPPPTTTLSSRVGWRLPLSLPVPPSVTPW